MEKLITLNAASAGFNLTRAVILGLLLYLGQVAQAGHDNPIASPVSDESTSIRLPGKLVWVDLVTPDVARSASFYREVFEWELLPQSASDYVELSLNGRPIASVVAYDSDEAGPADARWLVSISVDDADDAASVTVDAGGNLLEAVADFENRGRYALVSDPQGALLMLLDASGGDPPDDPVRINDWAFAELWTDDLDAAVTFYREVAGYDVAEHIAANGERRVVLGSNGVARATVVGIPWPDVEPNWLPYVAVADAAATLGRVEKSGGHLLASLPETGGNPRIALVMDPTGGVFAIQQAGVNE